MSKSQLADVIHQFLETSREFARANFAANWATRILAQRGVDARIKSNAFSDITSCIERANEVYSDLYRLGGRLARLLPDTPFGVEAYQGVKDVLRASGKRTKHGAFLNLRHSARLSLLPFAADADQVPPKNERGEVLALTKIEIAMRIMAKDPHLSDAEVARRVPCSKSYLTRNSRYQHTRIELAVTLPRGRKTADGHLEAEDG